MITMLKHILNGEVFMEHDRQRLRELVTMNGISAFEQAELYREIMKPGSNRAFDLMRMYELRGATYTYPSKRDQADSK